MLTFFKMKFYLIDIIQGTAPPGVPHGQACARTTPPGYLYEYLAVGGCATETIQSPEILSESKKTENVKECYALCKSTSNCGYFAFYETGSAGKYFGKKYCDLYPKSTKIWKGNEWPGVSCYKMGGKLV